MKSIWLQAGLGLGLCLSCVGAARAQDPVAPAPSAPDPDEPGDDREAPAAVLSVPMPGKKTGNKKGEENGNDNGSDPADATPVTELGGALPGDPWGDSKTLSIISLRGLSQTRYTSTFGADSQSERLSYQEREELLAENNDGWGIERLLVRLSSDPVKYIGFKAVLDFAQLWVGDPDDVLKQGYVTLSPIPTRLEGAVGLFKLPFSVLELDPTARFEFASFGPTNQLLGDLGFKGRDLGLQLMGAPLPKAKRLTLIFGMFRGHAHDEHDSPAGALAGRIEYKPKKWLRLGAGTVQQLKSYTYNRPFETSDKEVLPNPVDPMYPAARRWGKGGVYGADVRFKKKGFMARGEAIYGDRVDVDRSYGATEFWSAWGILAYGFDVHEDVKLLPAVRLEWLDTDLGNNATYPTTAPGPKGTFVTVSGSFTCIAWQRARFLIDVTYTNVEKNTPVINQPKPLQADPYMALSNTRITAQLQLEL